jgi:hypothetical protein
VARLPTSAPEYIEHMWDHDAEFAPRFRSGTHEGKAVLFDEGGDDPWQSVRIALKVVSLDAAGGNVEDPSSYPNTDVEAPDLSDAIRSMNDAINEVLTEQERHVIVQRLGGDTYADIAEWCEPPLSGPSQARKIEQRALRKLRERLSAFRKKKDRS